MRRTAHVREEQGRLAGRVALVTGAASGIGRSVVQRYLEEGACVGILDHDSDGAAAIVNAHPGRVISTVGDVRDRHVHAEATEHVLDTFGRLDVYVGNAGLYDYGKPLAALDADQLDEGFAELFHTNVLGYLLGVRTALPALRDTHGSVILSVSSSGSYAGGGGTLYVASKHAVVGMIRQLAYELAPDIRVNGVAPGATRTALSGLAAFNASNRHLDSEQSLLSALERTIPLGFVSEPDDHAGLYVLLADPKDAGFITAAVLPSDGGLEIRGSGRGPTTGRQST